MKQTVEIKQIYTAFYWRRVTEEHIIPFWWLDFEDDVMVPLSLNPSTMRLLYPSHCSIGCAALLWFKSIVSQSSSHKPFIS